MTIIAASQRQTARYLRWFSTRNGGVHSIMQRRPQFARPQLFIADDFAHSSLLISRNGAQQYLLARSRLAHASSAAPKSP
jgi:hypothetical protein